jgi:hypothetical protein
MTHVKSLAMSILVMAVAACDGEIVENVPEAPRVAANVESAKAPDVSYHFDKIQQDIDTLTCSSAGCHGSKAGGFGLSQAAAGSAVDANYEAFKLRAANGDQALVLLKATGETPHGGGTRFAKADPVYARWLTWIREGSPR